MKQHAKRQRPGFESLENRQLLAGTVLIDDSGGNLVITGDALANHIEIRQTGLAEFTVTGKDGEQIRSPGGIFQKGPVTIPVVRGGLLVSLGSGDDSVGIEGTPAVQPIGAFLTIITGSGKDQVKISNVHTGGQLYPPQMIVPVELKRRRSVIGEAQWLNALTPGSLTIDTGAGDKLTDADTVNLASVKIEGPTMINTGPGADLVTLDEISGRQVVIDTASGADRVELAVRGPVSLINLHLTLANDNDYLNIGTSSFMLTGIELSRFEGGRGLNYLTGYANLNVRTRSRLVNPRTTGFIVDPVK